MGMLNKLRWPLSALIILMVPALFWDNLLAQLGLQLVDRSITVARYTLGIGLWLSVAWLAIRLLDAVVWDRLAARKAGGGPPKLMKDLLAAIIWAVAAAGITGGVFDLPITGLWATSGALGLVVGLAVQSMINDVFSGLALNIDRPFRPGQWVALNLRGQEPFVGKVRDTNWRSTRLETIDGLLLVIPNGLMSTSVLTNFSEPHTRSRFKVNICLDFGVPVERAQRILGAAVRSTAGVLSEPPPKVNVGDVSRYGVEYELIYWLEPAECSPAKGRSRVTTSVLAHLHSAGITPAYEKMDVFHGPMPPRQLDSAHDRKALLARVALFRTLGDGELAHLASQLTLVRFHEGDTVVAQGEDGESMYIVVEGLLHVFAPGADGVEMKVAQLVPGQFFGEMSLLSGAPRSATVRAATDAVTFEIGRASFKELLAQRTDIAVDIAQVVAERRTGNAARRKPVGEISKSEETPASYAMHLLGKMRSLFGLAERKNGADGSA